MPDAPVHGDARCRRRRRVLDCPPDLIDDDDDGGGDLTDGDDAGGGCARAAADDDDLADLTGDGRSGRGGGAGRAARGAGREFLANDQGNRKGTSHFVKFLSFFKHGVGDRAGEVVFVVDRAAGTGVRACIQDRVLPCIYNTTRVEAGVREASFAAAPPGLDDETMI